ncbi:MAG: ATP-dependent 6-phosphofructokinase [Dehalococcoidales bacterium]|nr:ATP-dependent 6-phosphofructokinase [Dehalococcoidales bacterium]
MKKLRIGVLTGGGDCAGLNSAVKWIVKTALDPRLEKERGVQFEVIGIREGWKGLVHTPPDNIDDAELVCCLTENTVRTWDRMGGTALGSSRTNPYNPKDNRVDDVKANIEKLGLDAVIAIGGDDTLGVGGRLAAEGIPVIGIPKTIDFDLPVTEYSLGYETALNVITEETDRIRTYAGSHKVVFVIETMGRHAGWLALEGGEAAGANFILIPEYDFPLDRLMAMVREETDAGHRYNIIMVAEGASPAGINMLTIDREEDAFGHVYLGGVGKYVADAIERETGMMTRSMALGYLQRGGAPCAYDRRMGRYFGIAAVDLLVQGKSGQMVCLIDGKITYTPIVDIVGKTKLVNIETQYDRERLNGRRTIIIE